MRRERKLGEAQISELRGDPSKPGMSHFSKN